MKTRIARICLAVGLVLFFSGTLILCDCPGWFALAAAFIGVAVWLGAGKTRQWAVVCLIGALLATGLEAYEKVRHERMKRELRKKIEDKKSVPRSNNPAAGNAGWTSQWTIGSHRSGLPEPGR